MTCAKCVNCACNTKTPAQLTHDQMQDAVAEMARKHTDDGENSFSDFDARSQWVQYKVKGIVTADEVNASGITPVAGCVGYVFGYGSLHPHFFATVADEVAAQTAGIRYLDEETMTWKS